MSEGTAEYKSVETCPKCGAMNQVTAIERENGIIGEAETKCLKCGHEDYFAYGSFMSETEGKVQKSIYDSKHLRD